MEQQAEAVQAAAVQAHVRMAHAINIAERQLAVLQGAVPAQPIASRALNPAVVAQPNFSPSGRMEASCMGDWKSKIQRLKSQATATTLKQGLYIGSPQYSSRLVHSLYQHQQSGLFCDFKLKLDSGREIPIHKMVLSSTSTYFSCLFQSQMLETQQGFVELKGMKDVPTLELVKFMYTGKFHLSKDTINDMVDTACHLQIIEAIALCSDYLISTITKENCVETYNLSDHYSLTKVKESAFNHMRLMFTHLPDEQLLLLTDDQITALVESDALVCTSEWDVFKKVATWLMSIGDLTVRTNLTEKLMKLVRFPLMSGEELVSKVSRVEMMQNKECAKILTEAKDYHIVVSTQPVLQTRRTRVRHANIIYMAACQEKDFFVYPLFSPDYKLVSDGPVELRKPPRALTLPSVCIYNNFLYVCGGVHDKISSTTISSARCYRYDPRTDTWLEIASMQEPRQGFDLIVVGDYMFALGGWDETVHSNTYEVYAFGKDEWIRLELPPSYQAMSKNATVSWAQSIYSCGGAMGAYTSNAMFQYVHDSRASPGSLILRQLPPMHKARKRHQMFAHNNKIFVLGGQSTSVEVFDILTEKWTLYEGFADTLGTMTPRLLGVCSLDPTRLILVSYRDSNSNCMLLNLEKDPVKEKNQFVKKLNADPKISGTALTTFGQQIWLHSLESVIGRREVPAPAASSASS